MKMHLSAAAAAALAVIAAPASAGTLAAAIHSTWPCSADKIR
jgi:hypothetical protein